MYGNWKNPKDVSMTGTKMTSNGIGMSSLVARRKSSYESHFLAFIMTKSVLGHFVPQSIVRDLVFWYI